MQVKSCKFASLKMFPYCPKHIGPKTLKNFKYFDKIIDCLIKLNSIFKMKDLSVYVLSCMMPYIFVI